MPLSSALPSIFALDDWVYSHSGLCSYLSFIIKSTEISCKTSHKHENHWENKATKKMIQRMRERASRDISKVLGAQRTETEEVFEEQNNKKI